MAHIDHDRIDSIIRQLADEDGVQAILLIPGVWEHVSEHYNNAAIRQAEEEDAPCDECGGERDAPQLVYLWERRDGRWVETHEQDICDSSHHDRDGEDQEDDDDRA